MVWLFHGLEFRLAGCWCMGCSLGMVGVVVFGGCFVVVVGSCADYILGGFSALLGLPCDGWGMFFCYSHLSDMLWAS